MRLLSALVVLACALAVAGCPLLVVGGGAAAISAIEDRRTSGTIFDDDSIERHISRVLRERFGENTHVDVTSYNRTVLLTGEVPDEARRAEIEKIAQAIGNVRSVVNELQVSAPSTLGARANDSLITTRVKGRLLDSNKVNPLHVKVVTEAGVVYLMGIVTEQEADDAVDIARTTGQVIKVVRIFELCKAGDGVCKP